MSEAGRKAQILDSIVPKLEAEGYSVYLQPTQQLLPTFMGDYVPDAIALGQPRNVAIEIALEGATSESKLTRLRGLFDDAKDWELRVFYVRPATAIDSVEAASKDAIKESLASIERLRSNGQTQPALLMAWATLEAIGRALLPRKFRRPQTPGRLIEVLATDGFVTPSEADVLRRLANGRNGLIHGNLAVSADPMDLEMFVSVLHTLMSFVPKEE
jgi:uncharacterized protein YutE (UPF0331/DUF86 family)